jgi:N-hydroxyarylamine O-acetyltransferase
MAGEVNHLDNEGRLDIGAYLSRIGYAQHLDPTIETLSGLHFAHATRIPFENLDILLGRPIAIDLASLQSKLVTNRRGGYCFEQNTLFAAVLESVGFRVTRLAARVRFGSTAIRPRSHMLVSVAIDDGAWLADVGFGGEGLLYPIRIDCDEEVRQGAWTFRVIAEGEIKVLQSLHADGWFDLYAFTREPQYAVDFEVSNHFTSTYPRSPFVQSLIVQRSGLDRRWTLRNRELSEQSHDAITLATLPDDDALLATLAEVFNLNFPAGTRFRYSAEPAFRAH